MSTVMPNNFPYLPSLSEDGWISDDLTRADRIFAHAFIAEYSQSALYPGEITSIQYILAEYGNNPNRIASALETQLTKYFERYFNSVELSVDYPPGQVGSRVYITIACAFQGADGKNYNLTKVAQVVDSKVVAIENLNNGT